jgi:hypothetical protein
MSESSNRIPYYDLVLGKVYYIKRQGSDILYKGLYHCHYRKYFDEKEPLTFVNVIPNPENKKLVEFNQMNIMDKIELNIIIFLFIKWNQNQF